MRITNTRLDRNNGRASDQNCYTLFTSPTHALVIVEVFQEKILLLLLIMSLLFFIKYEFDYFYFYSYYSIWNPFSDYFITLYLYLHETTNHLSSIIILS